MKRVLLLSVLMAAALLGYGCNPTGDRLVRNSVGELRQQGAASSELTEFAENPLVDGPTRNIILQYGPAVKRYSSEYGFDWRLVLAVMKCESSFIADAESHRGAFGFMQLMPRTGSEIGRKLAIDVTADPEDNIRGGIYYLGRLYNQFPGADPTDRLRLTLAAYNAGIGRVNDAREVASYLYEDPNKWSSVRDALPLLSKRYYTLHSNVFADQKPASGWFGGSDETVTYVKKIMDYYDDYMLVLN